MVHLLLAACCMSVSSAVLILYVFVASDGLSTCTNSVLKLGVFQSGLSWSYMYCFCAAVGRLSIFSVVGHNMAGRWFCYMLRYRLPHESKGIIGGDSIFVSPSACLDSTTVIGHTCGSMNLCRTRTIAVGQLYSSNLVLRYVSPLACNSLFYLHTFPFVSGCYAIVFRCFRLWNPHSVA